MTPEQQEEYEERAAIFDEYDGKLPRAQAEKEAMRLILAKAVSNEGRNA